MDLPSSSNTSQITYVLCNTLQTPKTDHTRDQRVTHRDKLTFDCLVEPSADCPLFGGLGGASVRSGRKSDGDFHDGYFCWSQVVWASWRDATIVLYICTLSILLRHGVRLLVVHQKGLRLYVPDDCIGLVTCTCTPP